MDNPKVKRGPDGRWLPGYANANPKGRPNQAWKTGIDNALRERFSPERIAEIYEQALAMAIKTGSPKTVANIAEYLQDRVVGKPVQAVHVSQDSNLIDEVLERMAGNEDKDEVDGVE